MFENLYYIRNERRLTLSVKKVEAHHEVRTGIPLPTELVRRLRAAEKEWAEAEEAIFAEVRKYGRVFDEVLLGRSDDSHD